MKHQTVDHTTELKVGDFIIVKGEWAEIYHITEESGINTSRGWICRSKLYESKTNPDLLDLTKPICFLDLDGVCNSANFFKTREVRGDRGEPANQLDPQSISFLNEIADWNFVLSSTWRKFYPIDKMNELMKSRGFKGEIISYTPVFERPYSLRGNEIHHWMHENLSDASDFKRYIIFDDDSDLLYWQRNNFVSVDGYWGIGPGHIYRAKRIVEGLIT
jgi:hypothetical protein